MSELTTYADILRVVAKMKDAKTPEGPRVVKASRWFIDKATEYGVTPQVLFDALIEFQESERLR